MPTMPAPGRARNARASRPFAPTIDGVALESRRLMSADAPAAVNPADPPTPAPGATPTPAAAPIQGPQLTWLQSMQAWLNQLDSDLTHWLAGSHAPDARPAVPAPPVPSDLGLNESLWDYYARLRF